MSEREPTDFEYVEDALGDWVNERTPRRDVMIAFDALARIQAHVEALEGERDELRTEVLRLLDVTEPPTTCPTCGMVNDNRGCFDPWHTVPTGTEEAWAHESSHMPKPKPTTEQQFIREAGRGHQFKPNDEYRGGER